MKNSPSSENAKPGIGVAVVVWQDDGKEHLLLGLGHSAENKNEIYAVPGGHWESGETLSEAAVREAMEEAGIKIKKLRLMSVYEFFNPEKKKSYVSIGFECVLAEGTPKVMEPDKKANWGWYKAEDAVKLPLFVPDKVLIERTMTGILYQ